MNYATIEVDLRNGRVTPRDSGRLPDSARALLVVLESEGNPAHDGGNMDRVLSRIRDRQAARGYVSPTGPVLDEQIQRERESWD